MADPVSSLDRPRFFIPEHTRTKTFTVTVPAGSSELLQPARRPRNSHWSRSVNNWLVSQAGERACNQILQEVQSQLTDPLRGYLVRVNAQEDAMQVLRPGPGQLATPLGAGKDPIDVLAEEFRKPQLSVAPAAGLRDASWYCWLSTGADGSLILDSHDIDATDGINANARVEAERRNVMGEFLTDGPPAGIYRAQRAEYWQDVSRQYFRIERGREEFLRLDKLNQEMAAAQSHFNAAYENYQTTLAEMARQQRQAQAIDRIGAVLQLVSTGVSFAEASAARAAQQAKDQAVQRRLDELASQHAEQSVLMLDRMRQLETRMINFWRDRNITPPASAPIIRLRREGGRLVPVPL